MKVKVTTWQENRFSVLLAALLLFFLAAPLYQLQLRSFFVESITFVLFALILILSLRVTEPAKRRYPALVALAALTMALLAAALVTESEALMIAFYLLNLLFLASIVALTVSRLMRSGSASYETIAASLCGYILLIMLWANTYSLVDTVTTGSFAYALAGSEGVQLMRFAFGDAMLSLYYSFVTMTTLGYGDVLPVSPMARVLAATQAFVGQVYITVLVARLVGLEIAERASATK